jgi:hypothetical protein
MVGQRNSRSERWNRWLREVIEVLLRTGCGLDNRFPLGAMQRDDQIYDAPVLDVDAKISKGTGPAVPRGRPLLSSLHDDPPHHRRLISPIEPK